MVYLPFDALNLDGHNDVRLTLDALFRLESNIFETGMFGPHFIFDIVYQRETDDACVRFFTVRQGQPHPPMPVAEVMVNDQGFRDLDLSVDIRGFLSLPGVVADIMRVARDDCYCDSDNDWTHRLTSVMD